MMMLIAVLKQNKNGLYIEVFLLEKKKQTNKKINKKTKNKNKKMLANINDSYMTMQHAFYKCT